MWLTMSTQLHIHVWTSVVCEHASEVTFHKISVKFRPDFRQKYTQHPPNLSTFKQEQQSCSCKAYKMFTQRPTLRTPPARLAAVARGLGRGSTGHLREQKSQLALAASPRKQAIAAHGTICAHGTQLSRQTPANSNGPLLLFRPSVWSEKLDRE